MVFSYPTQITPKPEPVIDPWFVTHMSDIGCLRKQQMRRFIVCKQIYCRGSFIAVSFESCLVYFWGQCTAGLFYLPKERASSECCFIYVFTIWEWERLPELRCCLLGVLVYVGCMHASLIKNKNTLLIPAEKLQFCLCAAYTYINMQMLIPHKIKLNKVTLKHILHYWNNKITQKDSYNN